MQWIGYPSGGGNWAHGVPLDPQPKRDTFCSGGKQCSVRRVCGCLDLHEPMIQNNVKADRRVKVGKVVEFKGDGLYWCARAGVRKADDCR